MAVTPGDTIVAAIAHDAGSVVETYRTSTASWTATTAKADTIGMRWFGFAGAADQPAGDTDFSVQIGAPASQCFGHPVTKKVD